MDKDTVEIRRKTLKQLLEMHDDATKLLEELPVLMDEGKTSEASSYIGKELEARIQELGILESDDETFFRFQEERNKPTRIEDIEEKVI